MRATRFQFHTASGESIEINQQKLKSRYITQHANYKKVFTGVKPTSDSQTHSNIDLKEISPHQINLFISRFSD